MDTAADNEEETIEAGFARTVRYMDLYLQQKTDLFLQHYVFEPFDFLGQKAMYLSVVVTLLIAGTLVLLAGAILLVATVMPLWAALLVSGVVILCAAGAIAYGFFHKQIVLQTPTAREMMNREKP
jgi:hypothetical protein